MDTDDRLVRRVLSGDKPAFGELVDRHRPVALRLARRVLRRGPDVEDVVQEAFLHAFLSLHRLRTPAQFRSWLLGIVLNLARSIWRGRREYSLEDWAGGRMMADPAMLSPEPSPEIAHEAHELHRLVAEAIATLPAEQRDSVELHYLEGLRVWEIASIVDAPVGTIKARLHRARVRLRDALTEMIAIGRPGAAPAEEAFMIEVTVEDVIVRAPIAEPGPWPEDPRKSRLDYWRIVLLKERAGERVLPIWMHPHDGDWIGMRLEGLEYIRPMPHDLVTRLLDISDLRLEKVAVTTLRDNIFYGTLSVRAGDHVHEIDARPSDAIAIALDRGVPIFIAEELLSTRPSLSAGHELPGLEAYRQVCIAEGKAEPDADQAYRSFRGLPRSGWIRPRAAR